ncbi:MAG TPA: glycosyltransferase family 1 protein, partial [Acidimicrobiales bacterium]|nr:glycosyltransferase family 1 protein [Acidimicrobiales bacterium]
LAFLRHPEYFTSHGLRFFGAALERMRRDADVVLCSSEATRADAAAAGFATERLRVVPLGVAAPVLEAGHGDAVRRRLGIEGRYVLHLGTAEPRKNTAALLRAAPGLPDDVTVVLAGGAGWGDVPEPTAGSRVRDVGFVSEADKWALLAGASVVCAPSLWEGFGLPALEAMAMATPVVTSAATSLEEVVGDAGICVDPRDDDALGAALRLVLEDSATAADLATRGRQRAEAFSWKRTAAATVAAYETAAA